MQRCYRLFLFLASRPAFCAFWLFVRKLSAHALNMSAACRLQCNETGEQIALDYVLSKREQGKRTVILDVGANVGQYTSMCLARLKPCHEGFDIHSFEPTSAAAEALRQRFQQESGVHVYQLGLGEEPGEFTFHIPWHTCAGASSNPDFLSLWPTDFSGEMIVEKAQIESVDSFMRTHSVASIHLLKIDVEGTELGVIRGAGEAIESRKIKFIQFEVSGGTLLNRTCLRDFWRELSANYKFYLILNQGLYEIKDYSPHLENFVGASNFLLELD